MSEQPEQPEQATVPSPDQPAQHPTAAFFAASPDLALIMPLNSRVRPNRATTDQLLELFERVPQLATEPGNEWMAEVGLPDVARRHLAARHSVPLPPSTPAP